MHYIFVRYTKFHFLRGNYLLNWEHSNSLLFCCLSVDAGIQVIESKPFPARSTPGNNAWKFTGRSWKCIEMRTAATSWCDVTSPLCEEKVLFWQTFDDNIIILSSNISGKDNLIVMLPTTAKYRIRYLCPESFLQHQDTGPTATIFDLVKWLAAGIFSQHRTVGVNGLPSLSWVFCQWKLFPQPIPRSCRSQSHRIQCYWKPRWATTSTVL